MAISFNPRIGERIKNAKTSHQVRREQRMKEATADYYQQTFGKRTEFGKRTDAEKKQVMPKRSFGRLDSE